MPLIPSLPYKPGYRPQAEDTSIEVDILYFTRLRQQSLTWRLERFMSFELGILENLEQALIKAGI
jgi:hypothetical protein